MYPQGQFPTPSTPPQEPVPPLPSARPDVVRIVSYVQYAAAGVVLVQTILGIIVSSLHGDGTPYLSPDTTGLLVLVVLQLGAIITVAVQSHNGLNAWRIAGTVCAGLSTINSISSLSGYSATPFLRVYGAPDGYAIAQMILSGLLAAIAIAAIVLWWTRPAIEWFAAWARVRRYATQHGLTIPKVH